MDPFHPPIEPYASGRLDVGDGDVLYWEACGNPDGKPAVALHGGPGSGCTPATRRFFDPRAYRAILFDQRNCGRSTPHASDPTVDLSANTTANLVADIERLREHVGVEQWLVFGGSWGSALALAYAEAHPERVSELVLFGVATGRHAEFDWVFRGGVGRLFPAERERVIEALPPDLRALPLDEAYHHLLSDPDAEVRRRAAEAWCLWESATPDWPPQEGLARRFRDPAYALAFARIVTHYSRANAWLEDGALLRGADRLAAIPGTIVQGRFDLQSTLENAWLLHRAWPGSELVVVDDSGHAPSDTVVAELVRALHRFAADPRG